MSGSESLDCEAPASLWISQETGRNYQIQCKAAQVCRPSINSGQAVQSQAGAPDIETISEGRVKQDVLD